MTTPSHPSTPSGPHDANDSNLSLEALQALLPDSYRLEKPLASGSFGQTFLAYQGERPCVIKMLALHRSEDWKCIDLFEREAKLLKHLDHPHIPNYIDSFTLQEDGETYFLLVQEYVRGKTLEEWVEDGRRFQYADILNMARQAADILIYLHQFTPPIIHRDLKPSNFMLDESQKLWIIDFGAVRDTLLAQGTRGSTIIGTFGYMPMEQYEGRAQPASDLYALGMTLIYLLTRQEPSQLPKRQLRPDFRSRTQVPEPFARLVDKLVDLDLQHRYRSAEKLHQDIERLQQKQAQRSPLAVFQRFKGLRWNPATVSVAGVTLALLGILALVFYLGRAPEQAVLAPPEKVENDTAEVVDYAQEQAKPWLKFESEEKLREIAVMENGSKWSRSSSQELFYYPPDFRGSFKWTARQVLGVGHIHQLLGNHNTIFVLGSGDDWTDYQLAYTRDHNAEWQRIKVPFEGFGVKLLFVDREDNLWLSHQEQVWVYDLKSHAWQKKLDAPYAVYAATEDEQGRIWLGVMKHLMLWDGQELTEQGAVQKESISLLSAAEDHLLLGTDSGLHLFNPETRQSRQFLPKQKITAIQKITQGWMVGSEKSGLHWLSRTRDSDRYRLQSWDYARGLLADEVTSVSANAELLTVLLKETDVLTLPLHQLGIEFEQLPPLQLLPQVVYDNACQIPDALMSKVLGKGVSRHLIQDKKYTFFDKSSVCPYSTAFAFPDSVFYFDREKMYQQRGLRIRSQALPVESYLSPEDMFYQGEVSYLSLSKSNYLYRSQGKPGWTQFELEGGRHFVPVGKDLYAFKKIFMQKELYVKSLARGRETDAFQAVPLPDLLSSLYIRDVVASPDQKGLFIASLSGLIFLEDLHRSSRFRQYSKSSGLPTAYVNHLSVTPEGDVWMLLDEHGLAYFEQSTEKIYTWSTREGLISQFLSDLTVMGDEVWVKAHDDRVARYKITDLLKNHAKIQKNTTRNAGS